MPIVFAEKIDILQGLIDIVCEAKIELINMAYKIKGTGCN